MVNIIQTNDTEDKETAFGAWIDATLGSAEALKANPALGGSRHTKDVDDVLKESKAFVNFDEHKGDQDYINHNNGKVPHTKVTLRISSRNFTPTDSTALESHLRQTFPNVTFGKFIQPAGKRRILIHINL